MNWIENKTLAFFDKTNGFISNSLLGGMGVIIMLHRVLPLEIKNLHSFTKDLAISTNGLESVINHFKKQNISFVSIDEVVDIISGKQVSNQKFVCFTLDDGYRDNLTYGLPLFAKHQVPFTIYVTNCFPNGTANLWWYWLEKILLHKNEITFRNQTYRTLSFDEKKHAFNAMGLLLKNSSLKTLNEDKKNFFNISETEVQEEVQELALSWEELNQIKSEPLLTIGAHTMNHVSLANQTQEIQDREINLSVQELTQRLDIPIRHFAYPFGGIGDVSETSMQIVKASKLHSATLNQAGNIFRKHYSFLERLPRHSISDTTTAKELNNLLNGVRHYCFNQFKRIV